MVKETNFYARLGLPIDATPEEIRQAYRNAARRLHPDINEKPGETELFIGVKEAYEVLSNPALRSAYDASFPREQEALPEVAVSALYSSSTLLQSAEPQLIYVLLEMESQKAEEANTEVQPIPPLNVCLVVDCSTSMQGLAMDTVKAAAVDLVRQIKENDILSLVAFSDRANVVLPAGSKLERSRIETNIHLLKAQGGTEIYKGLEAGYAQVRRNRRPSYINHLILLTDGRTYGDETHCLQLAAQAVEEGIVFSAFGLGSKWNDIFLDKLTGLTGGNSIFISKPEDIRHFLLNEVAGFSKSYADRVVYDFEAGPGVELSYAMRLNPNPSPLITSSPIQMGSIPSDAKLSVLFEFIVSEISDTVTGLLLTQGRLEFDIPARSVPNYNLRFDLERAVGASPEKELPPPAVLQAVARLTLYRMQERVEDDISVGHFQDATRRMQNLATHLFSQGEFELARTVLREAESLDDNKRLSEDGKKRIKYGTRALSLPEPSSHTGTSEDGKRKGNR